MRAPWIAPMLFAFPGAALAQADLTTVSANVSPTTVELGDLVTVSGQFGGTFIGNVEYQVVLSGDATLDPGDVAVQTDSVLFDGSGNPTAYTTTFPIPVIPAATWNVFVRVDSNAVVAESNETNNATAGAQTLMMRGADLRPVLMTGPEFGFGGGTYPITLTIANQGQVAATAFQYHYYHSDTPNIRVFSTLLGAFGPVTVPAGGELTVNDVVTLPTSTSAGYIGVIIDQLGDVPESNINNNIGRIVDPIRILDPSPELTGRLIEVPAQAAIGEQLAITRSLENIGVRAANFEYGYYLSTDPSLSTSDIELGRFTGALDPAIDDYEIDLMNVPFDVVPGNYYVGMIIDPANTVVEPNEADNTMLFGAQIEVFESAIRFMTESLPNATVGVPYQVGVYASGPLTVTFTLGDGALPAGMTLEPSGLIAGTAAANGRFEFTIRAHAGSAVGERLYSILVVETTVPLEVVPLALATGVVGRAYQTDLVAFGGQAPYTWSALGELPPGLELSEAGAITGTPIAAGEHPISIRARDSIGAAASRDFVLRIITPDQSLAIERSSLPAAIIGEDYCKASLIRFAAVRGVEPYQWSAVTELPPGMTLSAAGELCGTPTRVGDFTFTVRVQDQTGLYDSALFMLEISSETTFAISTTSLPDGVVGTKYDGTVEAFRATPPLAFTVIEGAGVLPPGLTLAEDGKISGAPTEPGVFAFVVHIVDGDNRSDSQPLSIAVKANETLTKDKSGCTCFASRSISSGALCLFLLLGLVLLRRR